MNVEEVRAIVAGRFTAVAEAEGTVLKAYASHAGKPFALWVFDCSQAISEENFDLRRHQDRLLRTDFYGNPGSLQWNLYCYFLCDEDVFSRISDDGVVAAVERDREYARKFVRTPAMLRSDLATLDTISTKAESKLPQDVGALWDQMLEKEGLTIVSSDSSYADTVRYIKAGQDLDATASERTSPAAEAGPITSIQAIDLGGFRHRPRTREFEFGRCNLIHGVNGSGKTSLLEAIEAWMCGKHRRNPDEGIAPDCLRLRTEGVDQWQPGPSTSMALYRQRDLEWYGNYQVRKNDLCFNFARFSFYDSDAAARLRSPRTIAISRKRYRGLFSVTLQRSWRNAWRGCSLPSSERSASSALGSSPP